MALLLHQRSQPHRLEEASPQAVAVATWMTRGASRDSVPTTPKLELKEPAQRDAESDARPHCKPDTRAEHVANPRPNVAPHDGPDCEPERVTKCSADC